MPTNKFKLVRKFNLKHLQQTFWPSEIILSGASHWNGISINLQPLEVMMARNYGCLSADLIPLSAFPSLWVQGLSLQLRPSPILSFSSSSSSLLIFAFQFHSKGMCNWILNWVPLFQGPQLMRHFALKSRLGKRGPNGQGLEIIVILYIRCWGARISKHW